MEVGALNADAVAASAPGTAAMSNFYRVVWRWHFYAGLFVAPVMLLATTTGALYVFRTELSAWLYQDLLIVKPAGKRLSFDEQRAAAQRVAGEFEVEQLTVWNNASRSTEFAAHVYEGGDANPNQKHRLIYVDPYTGQVLGTAVMEEEFFHQVLELHRTLFAGPTGRVIVELTTSWGLVLLVSGCYLWWPRGKSRVRGVWLPRLKGKPYVLLRDLHAMCGVYSLVFCAIILISGLFVSQVWGEAFTWLSVRTGQSLGDFLTRVESRPATKDSPPAQLDVVVTSVMERARPEDVAYIGLAETPKQAHKAYLMRDGDTNTVRGLDIDQYTGKLIAVTETADLKPMLKALAIAVSLHVGKIFGMPSKITAFVSCLALIALTVTGIWMWWQRRPSGATGFPQRPASARMPRWAWWLSALLMVLLPTVAASVVLILFGQTLLRRLGALARR